MAKRTREPFPEDDELPARVRHPLPVSASEVVQDVQVERRMVDRTEFPRDADGNGFGRKRMVDRPMDRRRVLITAVSMGLSPNRACKLADVSPSTLARLKKDDPDFAHEFESAREKTTLALAASVFDLSKSAENEAVRLNAAWKLLQVLSPDHKQTIGIDIGSADDEAAPDFSYL